MKTIRFTTEIFLILVGALSVLSLPLNSCSPKITPESTSALPSSISATAPVPSEYQPLYGTLSTEMTQFEASLNQLSVNNQRQQPVFATDLLFANGNVGEGLLTATNMNNNIILLNRLQAMGFKGVVEIEEREPPQKTTIEEYSACLPRYQHRDVCPLMHTSKYNWKLQHSSIL
jgi:hypothetical protein